MSLPLRLSTVPAAAGLSVLLLAALSLLELREEEERLQGERGGKPPVAVPDTLEVLERPGPGIRRSIEPEELSEEEALRALETRPSRAAVRRLLDSREHRARLQDVLLSEETPEEVRLYLLGRFEEEEPFTALEAARRIAEEGGSSQGPLLLSVYEILATFGEDEDLALLRERPLELPQTRARREEERLRLRERTGAE
jgi:hypothetical protein